LAASISADKGNGICSPPFRDSHYDLLHIIRNFHFGLPDRVEYTPSRHPLILQFASFLRKFRDEWGRRIVTLIAVERRLSIFFGVLIGGMWMGEVLLGNLGGTSVFGNLRDSSPRLYALTPWFAVGAVGVTGIGGLVTPYRTRSIATALRVGVWSGIISGVMVFVTGLTMVVLFHDAMMKDPSNIHEFSLSAHRPPTDAELSDFLYSDAMAGMVAHLFIGPLLGVTVGGIGAVIGKLVSTPVV
jgi:hypothetical protein